MAAITVGVPVYNEAELLAGALEALRTQPFADIEEWWCTNPVVALLHSHSSPGYVSMYRKFTMRRWAEPDELPIPRVQLHVQPGCLHRFDATTGERLNE